MLASDWAQKYFFAQSQTSIRISRGTCSFRVVSKGLSQLVLENFPFLIFAFISFRFALSKIKERKVHTVYTALIWFTLCFLLLFQFNKFSQQLQNSPLQSIPLELYKLVDPIFHMKFGKRDTISQLSSIFRFSLFQLDN